MDLGLNRAEPLLMHIDLNSCFASIEQQANRLIRGKPVAVAAYDTPRGMILAASYEAKALGIKLGTRVGEARAICPGIYITMPDPEKYREAHRKFRDVLLAYTDEVVPKSIDEFVIDFSSRPSFLKSRTLQEIGHEIKQRIYQEVGEAVRCNVGIGTNRFWAKTAAGLNKPDGLDTISADNVEAVFNKLKLTDLCGISYAYDARLKAAGVLTPLDFLRAPMRYLQKQVFRSIAGYYWYVRLRGHEIDEVDFDRKSYGHQYAIGQKTRDKAELSRLLMKLCEKTGRRLRRGGYRARSVSLALRFDNHRYYSVHRRLQFPLYSSASIYGAAMILLNECDFQAKATLMSVSVGDLQPSTPRQTDLFETTYKNLSEPLSGALDSINNRWGEFTIAPASMTAMGDQILDRIAFGNVKEL